MLLTNSTFDECMLDGYRKSSHERLLVRFAKMRSKELVTARSRKNYTCNYCGMKKHWAMNCYRLIANVMHGKKTQRYIGHQRNPDKYLQRNLYREVISTG